jgi:NADH-quinone oxidoreductase subunit C
LQEIRKEALVETLGELKKEGYDYLKKITAVDYGDYLTVVYIIYNTTERKEEVVTARILPGSPAVHTIIHIYRAADWYERELSEMFGITIEGRKARRLLLEEWEGSEYPMRKGFVWGKPEYKRM